MDMIACSPRDFEGASTRPDVADVRERQAYLSCSLLAILLAEFQFPPLELEQFVTQCPEEAFAFAGGVLMRLHESSLHWGPRRGRLRNGFMLQICDISGKADKDQRSRGDGAVRRLRALARTEVMRSWVLSRAVSLIVAFVLVSFLGQAFGDQGDVREPAAPTSRDGDPLVIALTLARTVAAGTTASSANPLSDVPLAALSATRDRPLFSASRRPQPIVAPVTVARASAPTEGAGTSDPETRGHGDR
ncbi:hypothetical protein ACQR16_19315 [Bradyrhizobium oligotrophicum]|uniref:hypothetical protein n=1 Tax=Bradyrhizobium oligotrophicum TaxID=44255 RepID=UPI003EBEC45F